MRVLSVPARLRLAASMLVLTIPFAALECVLYLQAPWWNLPYPRIVAASLAAVGLCLFLGGGILLGRRWVAAAGALLGMTWVLGSGWAAFREGSFWLGLLTLVLGVYWYTWVGWVRHELGRSYLDPGLTWYVGRPKPVPDLICRLAWDGAERELRVARMDSEGVFLFGSGIGGRTSESKLDLRFDFRGRTVSCVAEPVGQLPDRGGLGLRFCDNTADARKELGDFVEQLRGEGHVV
ncbi:MAG: hypothetical protein IT285_01045 [Bdellovibrionales bacterium]|nr:hypothetical protein [Bdellovibrionales bacterium]